MLLRQDLLYCTFYNDPAHCALILFTGYSSPRATLRRDPLLDEFLFDELQQKRARSSKFQDFQEDLPVYDSKNRILDVIRRNSVTIISGETGSGKTTQVFHAAKGKGRPPLEQGE